jgi:hypothetical protein
VAEVLVVAAQEAVGNIRSNYCKKAL